MPSPGVVTSADLKSDGLYVFRNEDIHMLADKVAQISAETESSIVVAVLINL